MRKYLKPAKLLHLINVCIGMAIFVCASSFMSAVTKSIIIGIDKFASNVIVLSDKELTVFQPQENNSALDWQLFLNLKRHFGARYDVAAAVKAFQTIESENGTNVVVGAIGTTDSFFKVSGIVVKDGRQFSQTEANSGKRNCIVGAALIKAGIASAKGISLNMSDGMCTNIGRLSDDSFIPGLDLSFAVIRPIDDLEWMGSALKRPLTHIFLRPKDKNVDFEVENEIVRTIGPTYDSSRIAVWFAKNYWEEKKKIATSLSVIVFAIVFVIIGLSALSIVNAMLLEVTERRKEIGLRMALGATSRSILLMFFKDGVQLIGVGGILGVLMGYLLTTFFIAPIVDRSGVLGAAVKLQVDAPNIVWALLLLLFAALCASLIPAKKAAATDPSLALRGL